MFVLSTTGVTARPASAHHPVLTGHRATSAETAIPMMDPTISQVVYGEITPESGQVWLAFDAPEGFDLYVQAGVPVFERRGGLPTGDGSGRARPVRRGCSLRCPGVLRGHGPLDLRRVLPPPLSRAVHEHELVVTSQRDGQATPGRALLPGWVVAVPHVVPGERDAAQVTQRVGPPPGAMTGGVGVHSCHLRSITGGVFVNAVR